ncbi:cell wall hydrolase [Natronospora cellulosivora (SeqCode)]
MSKIKIKYICLFTVTLLFFYSFLPVFISEKITYNTVNAYSINQDDVYKGIGIALLLMFVARIGQSRTSSGAEYNDTIDNELVDRYIDGIDISREDFDLLARIIHAESRGEPYIGQVAVAAVVINRVNSTDFPNTFREVIYQERQFTPVRNGQLYLPANESAYRAAREALKGNDPSLGALFFYNPETAETLWWLSQRETTIIIENHVFAI